MAENLQNNDFSNLAIIRSLHPGMHMMGIADGEMQPGDMVTFEYNESGCPRVRRLTQDEVENFINHDEINRVERIARAIRYANVGDAIEFIIDQCCDYVTIHDINALPIPEYQGYNPSKKHQLDEDYPHICYKCKKKLKYLEAWTEIKKTEMTEERFKYLWELEQIEFYCCSCYDKEVRKENPSTYSISTPHPNVGRDFLARMRNSGRSQTNLYWALEQMFSRATIPLPPTPIHTDTLYALVRFAEIQFSITPVITRDWVTYNAQDEIPTFIEHRFDINVYGSGPHIHRRINMAVSSRNHSRFEGIPNPIDLTIHSDLITTVAIANLVAELVFHWASAKVLLKKEDEEWVDLNELQRENDLNRLLDEFIAKQNRLELVGEPANERFYALYPKFPHIFHLDDEHRQRCKLCGLTYLDLETVRQIGEPNLGWHAEYQMSMLELDVPLEPIIADYRERTIWQGNRVFEEHEHYYGPTGEESTCRYCGDVRNAIQRTGSLSE